MDDRPIDQVPYTASTLAQAAGVAPTYVARLCRQGRIAAVKVGRDWWIAREVGDAWLKKREAKRTA